MSKEELLQYIEQLENSIQRKEEAVSKDERAITKAEEEVNALESKITRTRSDSMRRTYSRQLDSKKKDLLRKKQQRDKDVRLRNDDKKRLLTANRQLTEIEAEESTAVTDNTTIDTAHMNKIYQIFVSSTFEDLKLERQEVMAAVVSTGNVPIGMEYFPAGNASPFGYIKQQIDGADYYVLIVAGKYGSINDETGKSYTEMEFDYAISQGIPVAVLLYKDLSQLKGVQLENSDERRQKLDAFRKKVCDGRMVAFWEDARDLKLKVKEAIDNLIKNSPRTGWIRADQVVVIQQETINSDILDITIAVEFNSEEYLFDPVNNSVINPKQITMKDILTIVVPAISTPRTESAIDEAFYKVYPFIKEESLAVVKACLLKYKLVETNTLIIPNDGVYTAWSVTPLGRNLWAQNMV